MNETRDKLALVFLGAILESGVQYKIGAVGEAFRVADEFMSRDIADVMGAPHCQSPVQSNHEVYLFFIDLKPEANFSHECLFCSVPVDNMHLLVSDIGHFPPSAELFEKMVKIQFPKALGSK